MLLNWVVVVLTHHGIRDVKGGSRRSVIPVHNREDAEKMASAIQLMDPLGEHYTAEVCVQIPAQKGNVLLTTHAVEELIEEWNEHIPRVVGPKLGPKLKFPVRDYHDEDESA